MDPAELERWLDNEVPKLKLPVGQVERLRELLRDPQRAPAQLFELGRRWQRIVDQCGP